jgi:hypothetical protein
MKINQLCSKPQLVKLTLDSKEVIKTFGEPIDFWTWDRQPLDLFMKLAANPGTNPADMIDIVRTLILDEQGIQVIQGDNMLPGKVLIEAMNKIVELLGK